MANKKSVPKQSHRQIASATIETMERRFLLSAVHHVVVKHPKAPRGLTASPISLTHFAKPSLTGYSTPAGGYTPNQIRTAYGLGNYNSSSITFSGIQGDGTGQTIAIVDAYDDPNAASDLTAFDTYFQISDPPSFTKLSQTGGAPPTTTDPNAASGNSWEQEESLDIEWAHVMAPGASIILYEANSSSLNDLFAAVGSADAKTGVSVVSMSWGSNEFGSETSFDSSYLLTSGITYVASTGDSGGAQEYPAMSPDVVAVGGTSLYASGGVYSSESAWSSGGGGISAYETRPSFQRGTNTGSTSMRTVPDISLVGDPNTGVPIYDTFDFGSTTGWVPGTEGGTSLSAPLFAGMVAIANQGRYNSATSTYRNLTGASQTLPYLYTMNSSSFHDITSGSNGHAAVTGYDLATGIGTPIANLLIPDLIGTNKVTGTLFSDVNGNGTFDTGESAITSRPTVYLDLNNNGVQDTLEPSMQLTAAGTYSITNSGNGVPAGGTVRLTTALAGFTQVPSATAINYALVSDTINLPYFPTTYTTTTASANYTLQTDATGTIDQIALNGTVTDSVAKTVLDTSGLTFSMTGSG